MILSQRMQFFIFFLVVAVVYSIAHQDRMIFFGDNINKFFPVLDYPLSSLSGWRANTPQRLIDEFFGAVVFNFYYKFIYASILEPFFGKRHFVDVYLQFGQIMWGLIFSGFTLISICYLRLFVKLNIWLMAIYALLFYLFFALYDGRPNSFNRLFAYDLTFLIGLCFLYPFAHYVVEKQNPFENWNKTHAISFMVVLGYLTYFSLFFTIIFVNIALLCLLALHFLDSYQRSDFQSVSTLWQKVKTEPKWALVSIVLSPILSLMYILIGFNSRALPKRLNQAEIAGTSLDDRFNIFVDVLSNSWDRAYGYDGKQIAFFIIILALALGATLISKWKTKNWKISKLTTQRIVFLGAGLALFVLAISIIVIITGRDYFHVISPMIRLVLITSILGIGFKLLQHKALAPVIYLLFFVFSFGSIRALTSMELDKKNAYLANAALKNSLNLGYTFHCYGEEKIPIHHQRVLRSGGPPQHKPPLYWKRNWSYYWNKALSTYMKTHNNIRFNKKDLLPFVFYYEPSIAKINAKLAQLQKTKVWQCARTKNDIYRIEHIDY